MTNSGLPLLIALVEFGVIVFLIGKLSQKRTIIEEYEFAEEYLAALLQERTPDWRWTVGERADHEHCRGIGRCWQTRQPCPALEGDRR